MNLFDLAAQKREREEKAKYEKACSEWIRKKLGREPINGTREREQWKDKFDIHCKLIAARRDCRRDECVIDVWRRKYAGNDDVLTYVGSKCIHLSDLPDYVMVHGTTITKLWAFVIDPERLGSDSEPYGKEIRLSAYLALAECAKTYLEEQEKKEKENAGGAKAEGSTAGEFDGNERANKPGGGGVIFVPGKGRGPGD